MKKNDFILVGMIILAVLFGFGGPKCYQGMQENMHRIAVITQDNKLVERIDLDTVTVAREIEIIGKYHEIIAVEKGRIRFKEADCPNKICVNTGWLEEPGDVAVCLPNRVVVRIDD